MIFNKKNYISYIILGLSLGFLITLRPIGITIALPVFIYTFFFNSSIQKKKTIFIYNFFSFSNHSRK